MDTEISERFLTAERERTLLIPQGHRDQRILRALASAGEAVRPLRGLYTRAAYWNRLSQHDRHRHMMRGYLDLVPNAVFTHVSAAVALGLSVSMKRLDHIHVATSRMTHSMSSEELVRHIVEGDAPEYAGGLRVTSKLRTVMDCTRSLPFAEGLAVADSDVRKLSL